MLLVVYIHNIVYMIMYIHVYIRTFFAKLRLSVYGKHSSDIECLCFIKITLKHPILVITVAHNPLRASRVPLYTNQCKHS